MYLRSIARVGFALLGTIVLGTIFLMDDARSADFCSDLKSAFAQSGNFGSIRGAAARDRVWASKLSITGGNPCELLQNKEGTNFSLICTMRKGVTQADATATFESLKAQAKSCSPSPPFNYNTTEREGQFAAKDFYFSDYEHGHSAVLGVSDMSAFAMPNEKQSAWQVQVTIFGR
jgi:hypothetical protein